MSPEHALGEAIWDLATDWYDATSAHNAGFAGQAQVAEREADLLAAIRDFITDQRHP